MYTQFTKGIIAMVLLLIGCQEMQAQYKSFTISRKGDTINAITDKGVKTGKWVVEMPELRGEPGYVEEGVYKNGEKDGIWRLYTLQGDLLGIEQYRLGGKHGVQQYYNFLGYLEREESWKGYDPSSPYDTVPVYGTGSNEILEYKIVKAMPYSVKHGTWSYYEPGSGRVVQTENWQNNNLIKPEQAAQVQTPYKKPEKTPFMLEWEKKNRGKKGAVRDGAVGL